MDTSKLEEQFAALRESNQQLAETVRIRDAEIVVIEGKDLPTISVATIPTTASATGPLLLGPGFIDLQRPAVVVGAVDLFDGGLRF